MQLTYVLVQNISETKIIIFVTFWSLVSGKRLPTSQTQLSKHCPPKQEEKIVISEEEKKIKRERSQRTSTKPDTEEANTRPAPRTTNSDSTMPKTKDEDPKKSGKEWCRTLPMHKTSKI